MSGPFGNSLSRRSFLAGTAAAGDAPEPKRAKPRAIPALERPKLKWFARWQDAVAANRAKPKQARPIFQVRILGELGGCT